jgi:hypothetical protein
VAVLLISYDLNGHERPSAYAKVKTMIETQSISWAKPLYSQWFVETNDTVDTWSERMKQVTDSNDFWFICHVKSPYQGWLPQNIWDWLNARA